MFEGSFAALGTVFVGLAAAAFGYITPGIGEDISTLDPSIRLTNMTALACGMFLVALIPWIICLIVYSFIYKTYPKDYETMRTILEDRAKQLEK